MNWGTSPRTFEHSRYLIKKTILVISKKSKHCWLVDSTNTTELRIQYQYYSAEMNAGSTFIDTEQLYVNPVNCLVYTTEQFYNPIQIDFEILIIICPQVVWN